MCITNRLIALFTTATTAVILSHAAAAQYYSTGSENSSKNNQKVLHQPRHAPPRPRDAPDVEYENHPFDQYRYLYDDVTPYNERTRRTYYYNNKSLQHIDGLRSRMRWLKKEEEQEVAQQQQQQEETAQTTEAAAMKKEEDSTIIFQTRENVVLSDNNSFETKTTESSTTTTTTTLDPTTDQLYKPLRIQFDVRHLIKEMELARSAGSTIVMTKLQLLIYEVLPMTAQVWGDTLRVIPVSGGIYPLAARGSSAEAWLPNAHYDFHCKKKGCYHMVCT